MAISEALVSALLSGGLTITNCQIVIGDNTQMGNLLQSSSASNQNHEEDLEVDAKLQSEKAVGIWKRLVEHHYSHVEGSMYVWDATQAEYGYMVYITSDILNLKHPSSNRLQWRMFHALFLNARDMECVAKVSVSNNINAYETSKSWCDEAKKLKRLLID